MSNSKITKILIRCIVICFVGIFMAAGIKLLFAGVPEYATFVENRDEVQFIHDIWSGYEISQQFVSNHDFEFVTLAFSDHDVSIQGKTQFVIRQKDDGKIVSSVEMDNQDIHFLQPVKLYLEEGGKKDQEYVITILSADTNENAALGLYGYIPDDTEQNTCVVNGEISEYAVGIGTHTTTRSFRIHFFIVMILLVIMLSTCFYMAEHLAAPEVMFLCIAVPMGLIFLSFLNVNIVHDGDTHLTNAYKYSNILMLKSEQDEYGVVYLTEDEAELRMETDNFYVLLEKMRQKESDFMNRVPYYESRATSADSILEYFPQVIGLTLGRILRLSPMISLMLAKIAGLFFYIVLCFMAIRMTPILKKGFAVAALLPMNLYQASGITYDAVITPVAYLSIAIIFKGRQQKLSRKEIIIFFILSIILGSCKGGIYIPILLLMIFALGNSKIEKRKKMKVCLTSWGLSAGALMLTYCKNFSDFFYTYESTGATEQVVQEATETVENVNASVYSLGYLFTNPYQFTKLFITTMIERIDYYIGSLIGNRMAWTDYTTNWIIIAGFIVVLVLIIAWDESEGAREPNSIERLITGGLLFCELVGIHAIMLVETKIGDAIISGVQGRYFLAFIPIIMFMLTGSSRKQTSKAGNYVLCMLSILQMIYIFDFITIVYNIRQ